MTADTATRVPIIKSKVGSVVSDKMDKTILVRVDSLSQHPLYKKRVRKSKKFMVHDEDNVARAGDIVRIVESRPTSKLKSWRLAEVVRSSAVAPVRDELAEAEAVEE